MRTRILLILKVKKPKVGSHYITKFKALSLCAAITLYIWQTLRVYRVIKSHRCAQLSVRTPTSSKVSDSIFCHIIVFKILNSSLLHQKKANGAVNTPFIEGDMQSLRRKTCLNKELITLKFKTLQYLIKYLNISGNNFCQRGFYFLRVFWLCISIQIC